MLRVNVFARDQGWLFEDLKGHFERADVAGVEIVSSSEPIAAADAWVCLRAREATASPDPRRTAVQIADLFDDGMYLPGRSRQGVRGAGGLLLCHPSQRAILDRSGISVDAATVLDRPHGASSQFTTRTDLPDRFHAGWVGKAHPRKRLGWFEEAMIELAAESYDTKAVLLGAGLAEAADRLREGGVCCLHFPRDEHPITDYPGIYRRFDCLVITSETEAGPFVLFEALATGVPVVSTPVGWAVLLAAVAPRYVRLADGPPAIAAALRQVRDERTDLFEERFAMSRLVERWRLEGWVTEAVELAAGLARPRQD